MRRLAMCAIAALLAAACTGSDDASPDTTTQPSTTIETATTTTELSTTTSTSIATTTTLDEWEEIKAWRGGPAGEYRTSTFEPAFKFTTPATFSAVGECADSVAVVKTQGDEFFGFLFFKQEAEAVDAVVESWQRFEQLSLSDPEETSIGGAEGVTLTGTVEDTLLISDPCGEGSLGVSPGTEMTLYIVNVNGQPVTIWVDEIPRVSNEDIQGFLNSITWKALG